MNWILILLIISLVFISLLMILMIHNPLDKFFGVSLIIFVILFLILLPIPSLPHTELVNEGTITEMHISGESYIVSVNGTEYRVDMGTYYSLHVGEDVKVYAVETENGIQGFKIKGVKKMAANKAVSSYQDNGRFLIATGGL